MRSEIFQRICSTKDRSRTSWERKEAVNGNDSINLPSITSLPWMLTAFIMISAGFESLISKSAHVFYADGE